MPDFTTCWWTKASVVQLVPCGGRQSFQGPLCWYRLKFPDLVSPSQEITAQTLIPAAQSTSVYNVSLLSPSTQDRCAQNTSDCQAWNSWQVLAVPGVAVVDNLALDFVSKNVSLHPCPSDGKSRGIGKGWSQTFFLPGISERWISLDSSLEENLEKALLILLKMKLDSYISCMLQVP